MDSSDLLAGAAANLLAAVRETESFTATCVELNGTGRVPPWLFAMRAQVSRIAQAGEVLEVLLRQGELLREIQQGITPPASRCPNCPAAAPAERKPADRKST